jgi:hypothetical protein
MKIKKQKKRGVGGDTSALFNNIDGDLISFPVASACDGKYYIIHDIAGEYKYIKDVKEAFKKEGRPYNRDLVIEQYKPDPIENTLHSVRMMIESIIEGAGNGPYQIYLTGKDNFRNKIATTKKYKGNRDGKRRPFHLQNCRDYLVRRWGAIIVDGEEADDACGYNQTKDTILSSTDKDLDCIPGHHYRWPDHGNEGYTYYVTETEANQNFYKQLLVGDTTDNITGCPGIGAKNAALKDIEELEDERDMAEYAFNKYFEYEMTVHCDLTLPEVKKIAYDKFLENGRLVWIRRKEGEIWSPPKPRR